MCNHINQVNKTVQGFYHSIGFYRIISSSYFYSMLFKYTHVLLRSTSKGMTERTLVGDRTEGALDVDDNTAFGGVLQ